MKANELRIGSYVLLKHSDWNEFEEVKITNGDSLDTYFMDMWEIKPIELNEEWLLKFGFEKLSFVTKELKVTMVSYKKENIVVYLLRDGFEVELIRDTDKEQFNLFLSFKKEVHQLQNLIHALTGE